MVGADSENRWLIRGIPAYAVDPQVGSRKASTFAGPGGDQIVVQRRRRRPNVLSGQPCAPDFANPAQSRRGCGAAASGDPMAVNSPAGFLRSVSTAGGSNSPPHRCNLLDACELPFLAWADFQSARATSGPQDSLRPGIYDARLTRNLRVMAGWIKSFPCASHSTELVFSAQMCWPQFSDRTPRLPAVVFYFLQPPFQRHQ